MSIFLKCGVSNDLQIKIEIILKLFRINSVSF